MYNKHWYTGFQKNIVRRHRSDKVKLGAVGYKSILIATVLGMDKVNLGAVGGNIDIRAV